MLNRKAMKKILLTVLFVTLFAVSGYAERQLLDRVVAVVNDEAITQGELDSILRPLYEEYSQQYQGQELYKKLGEVRHKLLSQLIEDRLVYQEAKKQGIEADQEEIDAQINDLRKRFPDEEAFQLSMQQQGLSVSALEDRLRRQLMIRQLHDKEIRAKVVVSPLEIDEYFQKHPEEFAQKLSIRIRSMTVKKSDESRIKGLKDEEAWQKIENLREQIIEGGDFEKLAKENSQDPHAEKGGLGDWLTQGSMIPEIDAIIFNMKKGEVSEVIETPIGYHFFRLEQKREEKHLELEDVREQIHAKLFDDKSRERFNEWLDELKRTAYVSMR